MVEASPCDVCDELRTQLVTGVMEFMTAVIAAEVCLILGRKKRALMMIKPPRQFVRSGIFEIDDNVFPRSEKIFADLLPGFVRQTFVFDFCRRIDAAPVEPRENGCRRHTVKAIVVVEDPYLAHFSKYFAMV